MSTGRLAGALILIGVGMLIWGLNQSNNTQISQGNLSGAIEIDGSSTVFPITEAVAEDFRLQEPGVQINVGISGTGGGFKRFTQGETDISDASRPIKATEAEIASQNNINYTQLRVALDGLAIVVNKENDFLACVTTADLKKIWQPESKISRWRQVRFDWPDEPIKLYGPGTDSGTFDYFTETINDKEDASRADYTASEDDNVLVKGVAGDKYSLGYFGYAYYAENKESLKIIAVDSGKGCVEPTVATIESGTYSPLSRPLFIYVKNEALKRAEVAAFSQFYLDKAATLAKEVGYMPLPAAIYQEQRAKLKGAIPAPESSVSPS